MARRKLVTPIAPYSEGIEDQPGLPTGIAEMPGSQMPPPATGIGTQAAMQGLGPSLSVGRAGLQTQEFVKQKAEVEEQKRLALEFQTEFVDKFPQSIQVNIIDPVKTINPGVGNEMQTQLDAAIFASKDPQMTPDSRRELFTNLLSSQLSMLKEQNFAKEAAGKPYEEQLQTAIKTNVLSPKEALAFGRPTRQTLNGVILSDEQKAALQEAQHRVNDLRSDLGRDVSTQEINKIFEDVGLPPALFGIKSVKEFLGMGVTSASSEEMKALETGEKKEEIEFYGKSKTGEDPKTGERVIPKVARAETEKLQKEYDAQLKAADYGTIAVRSKQIRNLLARGTQASDIGAIYAFIKLIDPPSVVRESEVGLVNNIGSIYDKFKQKYLSATGQSFMDDKVRLEFWDAAKTILNVYNEFYAGINKDFVERSKKLGVDKHVTLKDVNIDSGDLEIEGVRTDPSRAKIVPTKPEPGAAKRPTPGGSRVPTRRSSDAEIDAFLKANGKKATPENRRLLRQRLK